MELSEEEKEAIEYLKDRLEILHNNTQWGTEKNIQIVLNLIEKQQKEIEEIRQWKYMIDTYEDLDKLKELDLIKIKGKEYISKDKIRKYFMHEIAFKKRLQREKQKIDKYNRGRFDTIEEILELLEEN